MSHTDRRQAGAFRADTVQGPEPVVRWLADGWAPWLWGAAALAWWLAALYATLPVVSALPNLAQAGLQPLIWGAAATAGVLVIARLVFRGWPHVTRWPPLAALAGLVLAGFEAAALRDWSIARFGAFDAELVGPSAALFALVVASAVAAFAVFVAPRRASLPPLVVAVGVALAAGVVVATNVPGLDDGLGAGSVAVALLVAASGGYTVLMAFAAAVVAIRREVPMD